MVKRLYLGYSEVASSNLALGTKTKIMNANKIISLDPNRAKSIEKNFKLKPLEGKMSVQEEIINHIPHYSLDIDLKNIREYDLDFIIERLQKIKQELIEKSEITLSHIELCNY